MKKLILIISLLLLSACVGEPTIDGSSEASMTTSLKKMQEALPEEKYKLLAGAYVGLLMSDSFKNIDDEKAVQNSADKIRQSLHGMNYDQAIVFLALAKSKKEKPIKKKFLTFDEQDELNRKANFEKTSYYYPKVELYKVTAIRNDRGHPRIDFKLKNTGDKTLKRVEVTFWFKDKDGTVIHEDQYHPINTPLKPNYIWKQSRGMSFGGHDVPSEWQAGSFDAKITAVEFLESS